MVHTELPHQTPENAAVELTTPTGRYFPWHAISADPLTATVVAVMSLMGMISGQRQKRSMIVKQYRKSFEYGIGPIRCSNRADGGKTRWYGVLVCLPCFERTPGRQCCTKFEMYFHRNRFWTRSRVARTPPCDNSWYLRMTSARWLTGTISRGQFVLTSQNIFPSVFSVVTF